MKLITLISLLVLFLNSCSFFPKSQNVKYSKCDEKFNLSIQNSLTQSQQLLLQCLTKNNRINDVENIKKIFSQKINIRCELTGSPFYVIAEPPNSTLFPGYNINPNRLTKDEKFETLQNELFHESIHLLGYEHGKNFDLSNISDMCCLNYKDKNLNKLSQESCQLFHYQNQDWTSAKYLKDFSKFMAAFNHKSLVTKTTINAALILNRNNQKQKIYNVILAPLYELNKLALSKNLNRIELKSLSNDVQIPQAIILSQIGFKAPDENTIKEAKKINELLISRFYSYPIDKEKREYFINVSEIMLSVFNNDVEGLKRSWFEMKNRAEYLCRDLKKNEIAAIADLLVSINVPLFDFKNQIEAGEFYEMATYWNNPCEFHKSLKTGS